MHIYILIGRAQGQGVLYSIISDEIESSGHCEYIYANDVLIANKMKAVSNLSIVICDGRLD